MGRQLNTLNRYHAGLGYVVFACLLVQPMLKLHWISSAVPRVAMFTADSRLVGKNCPDAGNH